MNDKFRNNGYEDLINELFETPKNKTNKSKRPDRDTVITENEITDLKIMLNTTSVDDFLNSI